jgi:predicted enzyme related to lactoylglutathione lyase
MRLPPHPVWFWLILGLPFVTWLALWAAARFGRVSLNPLTPWLKVGVFLFAPMYFAFGMSGHKVAGFVFQTIFYTCWMILFWAQRRNMFETLRAPAAKWYVPWNSVEFSIPTTMRILVRDVNSVSPWYREKLGLRKLTEDSHGESDIATYKFKADGNSVVLTTREGLGTEKTPILFTQKIARMKGVLSVRGVDVGPIKEDRQGTRYFEIQDPEGNVIEVVEAP